MTALCPPRLRPVAALVLGALVCLGEPRAGEPDIALRPRPPLAVREEASSAGLAWSGRAFVSVEADGSGLVAVDLDGRVRRIPAPVPLAPGRVAADPAGGRLFVVDRAGREVLVLGPDGTLLSRRALPAGARPPTALAWDRTGQRLVLLESVSRRVWTLPSGGRPTWRALPPALREPAGLAVDASGRLLVGDRLAGRLVELAPSGRVVQAYDLAGIDPSAGLALAPSRDATDDPARESLFALQPLPRPRLLEATLERSAPAATDVASEANVPGSLVNAFATSAWSPPSPDPTGLAFRSPAGTLVVSDSEVEETNLFDQVNLWETTRGGSAVDTGDLTGMSVEPTGAAYDDVRNRYFFSDDDARRVFEVQPGPDGRPGTADDAVTSIRTNDFGATDPEGLAYDAAGDRLFVSDGVNGEVYVVSSGPDGAFNGVPPLGDDLVSSFDTDVLGLGDAEGVEYNADAGTLFIVSRTGSVVAETTPAGALVRMIDVSSLGLNNPSGLAYGPGSNEPSFKHLYVADRGVDNDDDPKENDGKIVEATLEEEPGTLESRVSASADDAEERASGSVALRSPDLEMTNDGEDQVVGMRFTGLLLPRGADVAEAWVQFRANEAGSGGADLVIRAEAADAPPAFQATGFNLSSRPTTAASAPWAPPEWLRSGDQGMAQRTSDLSAVLEEVLARPGWMPGNPVVLLITGSGRRSAKAWDLAPASAPLLHVRLATTCGDGAKGPGEECDGADLGGTTCAVQGCGGGTPSCTTTCTLDFSGCGVRPEACNGLDDDCDGTVDNAPPPSSRPLLTLEPGADGTVLSWTADPLATGYDLVRGSLQALQGAGELGASVEACLGNDLPATSAADPVVPAPDAGCWYLVRPVGCGGTGTYDDGDPAPVAPRDPAIAGAADACP